MAAFKWGSKYLDVIDGSYLPPHKKADMNEIRLIPSQDNTMPNSILQMAGRERVPVKFDIIVYDFEELNALMADDLTKEVKTFTDAYGLSMEMIMQEFAVKDWRHGQIFECSVSLLEA